MEAASLSVSINGDASGLLSAVAAANAALAGLGSTASSALAGVTDKTVTITAVDNASAAANAAKAAIDSVQDKTVTITAIDNASAAANAAKAAIDSVQDKTVTITVNYRTTGTPPKNYARGTLNAPEGLAMVNDERGVRDPRELIFHDGHYMMYRGRDVIVPLDRGDRVYTAGQTKAIMAAMGIKSYAKGKKNEDFEAEKSDFKSLTKSSNMSLDDQIAWWQSAVEKFADDYEVVKECNENIFSLTRKLVDNINDLSGIYIEERTHFNDWEAYGDTAVDAFERVRENNRKYLDEGFITYSEYVENVKRAGEDLYEGRIKQSEQWLKQQMSYNDMSLEDYIAGLERMAEYTREYFAQGLIDYREYADGLQQINNDIYDAAEKKNAEEYKHWEKDASNWKKMRDTYGDWSDHDDSPVEFYERCIERVKEFYEAGKIGWQEYMDDTFDYQIKLFKAQEDEIDESLKQKKDYITELKAKFKAQEKSLKDSWDDEDREADMADIRKQLDIYQYAVTQKGKNKYDKLKTELKQLEREEEIARLEEEHNEIIERLERELDIAEANKKGLLKSINEYGMSTNQLVGGIVAGAEGMKSFLSDMFSRLISAVEASAKANSYTDNSSKTYYNLGNGAASALKALASSVGRSFMYRF